MIEGLNVTVQGGELVELCRKHAAMLREKAKGVHALLEKLKGTDPNTPGGSNVRADALSRAQQQEDSAAELEWIAAHIDMSQTYLLKRDDLHRIGVLKERY